MNTSTLAVSAITRSALSEFLKAGDNTQNRLVKAADSLTADGVSFAHLATEKNGGNKEIRQQVKDALFLGLSKHEQAIASCDVKTLDDIQKVARKAAKDKVEIYLGKIRTHMTPKKQNESLDDNAQLLKMLEAVLVKMGKMENPTFDIVEAMKRVKAVKGMIV